jgi:sensor histidine kinase YesM
MPKSYNVIKHKLVWHLLFWVAYIIFYTFQYGLFQMDLFNTFLYCLFTLPVVISAVYFNIYYLMPRFLLTKRYKIFFLLLFVSAIAFTLLLRLNSYYLIAPVLFSGESLSRYYTVGFFRISYLISHFVSIYMVVMGAAFIKLLLQWYNSKQQNQLLAREKLETELKFLKSQIHPHFLFNTLNNLYALTLKKSDNAPETVLRLSELLDFMLYDCNASKISLDKELQLVKNYIDLEKLRYKNDVSIQFDTTGETSKKEIAPLLILPIVENCFKHGISEQTDKSWIKISLAVQNNTIKLIAENTISTRPLEDNHRYNEGIGIDNVRRRLQLLYPGNHELEMTVNNNVYSVKLNITV